MPYAPSSFAEIPYGLLLATRELREDDRDSCMRREKLACSYFLEIWFVETLFVLKVCYDGVA